MNEKNEKDPEAQMNERGAEDLEVQMNEKSATGLEAHMNGKSAAAGQEAQKSDTKNTEVKNEEDPVNEAVKEIIDGGIKVQNEENDINKLVHFGHPIQIHFY